MVIKFSMFRALSNFILDQYLYAKDKKHLQLFTSAPYFYISWTNCLQAKWSEKLILSFVDRKQRFASANTTASVAHKLFEVGNWIIN